MTLEEWKTRFAAWKEQDQREWHLKNGKLRTVVQNTLNCCCPITAEFDMPADKVGTCAHTELKLSHDTTDLIICAADKVSFGYSRGLRTWLLETCGVEEEAA